MNGLLIDVNLFAGGDVQTIVATTEAAFKAERNFIAMAAKSKKPSDKVPVIQA
jgi:hypothetical protein